MIGLDTNVLVRFLVEDDPAQTARAASFIQSAIVNDEELFVSDIVLCELVWVLSGAYGFGRAAITTTLSDLTRARNLRLAETDRVARALKAYASGRADFSDYLLREHALDAGCASIVTFDKSLLKEPAFIAP